MKRFWQGFGAALLLVAIAVFVVYPQYADYRSRSETSEILNFLRVEVQPKIEERAVKFGTLEGVGHGLSLPAPGCCSVREVLIAPNGLILAKGGKRGQVVMLLPSLTKGKVTWRCIGGRDEDVPATCR